MRNRYLEVTYRKGRPLAAYLYLERAAGVRSARTERMEPVSAGMLVDFDETGEPIGVEITAPHAVTLDALNRVLSQLGQVALEPADLAPLLVAA
jgi:hypothetical protein